VSWALTEPEEGVLDFTLVDAMLLDAGVEAPAPELALPDETAPDAPIPARADPRPFALAITQDPETLVVVGQGITLDFSSDAEDIEIDSVQELRVDGRRLAPGRVINGDERLHILPTHEVGAARIRLLRRRSTG
ncbi:MAG: DUF5597 domain-containing protein, partial [Leifsonia sp.]